MKKNCFLAMIIALFMTACGGGHKEYQINVEDVQFGSRYANDFEYEIYSSDDELTQIFEVIPGNYTFTTDFVKKGLMSGNNVNLTLKLRLLRPVKFNNELSNSVSICLLNADDKIIKNETGLPIGYQLVPGGGTWKPVGNQLLYDEKAEKDARMDFMDFLASPVGTEKEITFGSMVGLDDAKLLKDVTGIEVYINPGYKDKESKKLDKYYLEWAD